VPHAGLARAEAERRLASEGPNALPSAERHGLLALTGHVLREPMFMLLIAASGIYLVLGDLHEALVLAASMVVVVAITVVQERRTERAIEALRVAATSCCCGRATACRRTRGCSRPTACASTSRC
jgi:Ca2+-transporting ATPase